MLKYTPNSNIINDLQKKRGVNIRYNKKGKREGLFKKILQDLRIIVADKIKSRRQ